MKPDGSGGRGKLRRRYSTISMPSRATPMP
jgi:hypothetical protein